jgi:hypothetical protein
LIVSGSTGSLARRSFPYLALCGKADVLIAEPILVIAARCGKKLEHRHERDASHNERTTKHASEV